MNDPEETIAAISTPPGEGGIGIVRLSGKDALNISLKIFVRKDKRKETSNKSFFLRARKLYYGYVLDGQGNEIDEVLLSFMPGPHSYTCEDVVEINAHGGAVVLKNILRTVLDKGARLAEPGEFTKRAYLNGRLDLVQAESVLTLIKAKTDKALHGALLGLKGSLSDEIKALRAELISLLGQIEVEVDFAYDDPDLERELEGARDSALKIENMLSNINLLLQKRFQGKILQEGVKTVIAGRPNVGKSSLYNYFLREERAIVTDIPGTTRDLLMEYINVQGVPLKIIDTAGLHLNGGEVEKIGMELSRRVLAEADLILLILDASRGISTDDRWIYHNIEQEGSPGANLIIILNKIDLKQRISPQEVKEAFPGRLVLETSLENGAGLSKLEEAIGEMVYSGMIVAEESAFIMEARQEELLKKAKVNLEEAREAFNSNIPLDLISIDLRRAKKHLEELLGQEVGEDVLENVFQKFCIGK